MAMSRSFGGTSLTTRSPMLISPLRDDLEAGDHPQRGGLAAARRPDEDDELVVGDVEVEALHRRGAVRVDLPDVLEADPAHARPRCAAGARAHDELDREHVVDRLHRPVALLEGLEEQRGAEAPGLEERLADGGEAGVGRHLDVVVADDRQVLGHPEAGGPRRRRARRGPARPTRRRSPSGGRRRSRSSAATSLGERLVVRAVRDERGIGIEAGRRHAGAVAALALGGGAEPEVVGGVLADERDAPVPEAEQVLGGQPAALDVVGEHRRHVVAVHVDEDDGHPRRRRGGRGRSAGGWSDRTRMPSARSPLVIEAKCSSRCTGASTLNSTRS